MLPGTERAEGWDWDLPCSFWVPILVGSQARSQGCIGAVHHTLALGGSSQPAGALSGPKLSTEPRDTPFTLWILSHPTGVAGWD